VWMGSSLSDLRSSPKSAKVIVGQALMYAQGGEKHPSAKPKKGKLREVAEIRADAEGQAFRTLYLAHLGSSVYVLHAFNKKSTRGSEIPKRDMATILVRLRAARDHYENERKR